jgi:hypothetical protein
LPGRLRGSSADEAILNEPTALDCYSLKIFKQSWRRHSLANHAGFVAPDFLADRTC